MKIKGIIEEDTVNYKKISMYVSFPYCTFKCDLENNCTLCQNAPLTLQPNIEVSAEKLVDYFINNTISKAIVCCGLEPLDSFSDLIELLKELRKRSSADFVIYTGYNKEEVQNQLAALKQFSNVIVKFGRFIPNQKSHYDEVLGVSLASSNQYAEQIS